MIGIEMSLREIARRAREYQGHDAVHDLASSLTRAQPDVFDKVARITEHVRKNSSSKDADDAVLSAAAMCLSVGIPCRIVGARYGQSWTCWLSYQDEGQWTSLDVLGVPVGDRAKPDEEIIVNCEQKATVSRTGSSTRQTDELPDGVQIEARDKTTYNVERYVMLKAKDLEYPDNWIEVTVSGSVSSYKPEPMTPKLLFRSHPMTRKQWELVKRLSDQAWGEYEKRFPTEG
jgi:hypothetical protein